DATSAACVSKQRGPPPRRPSVLRPLTRATPVARRRARYRSMARFPVRCQISDALRDTFAESRNHTVRGPAYRTGPTPRAGAGVGRTDGPMRAEGLAPFG